MNSINFSPIKSQLKIPDKLSLITVTRYHWGEVGPNCSARGNTTLCTLVCAATMLQEQRLLHGCDKPLGPGRENVTLSFWGTCFDLDLAVEAWQVYDCTYVLPCVRPRPVLWRRTADKQGEVVDRDNTLSHNHTITELSVLEILSQLS